MTGTPPAPIRVVNLLGLAFLGVLVGYLIMVGWKRLDAGKAAPPPAESTAGSADRSARAGGGTDDSDVTSDALPPVARRSGSSVSVVGGMSPEELARLQRDLTGQPAEGNLDGPAAPPSGAPIAGAPLAPGETPASVLFPPAVREQARAYLCLCGCGHDLATCPCNDQPIGAVTMLTYLQKLMDESRDPAAVRSGMVERYGERVLLAPAPGTP